MHVKYQKKLDTSFSNISEVLTLLHKNVRKCKRCKTKQKKTCKLEYTSYYEKTVQQWVYIWLFNIYIKKSNEIRMLVHIKEISKKKNKTIFHNILVLTFSLLLQIFRYNVYKCTYDVNNIKGDYDVTFSRVKYITYKINEHL